MRFILSVWLALLAATQSFSDPIDSRHVPPTAAQLISRLPRLSPTNKSLQSFKATVSMPMMLAGFSADVAWSKNGDALMRAVTGPENVPCWFISQQQGFVFDASENRVTLLQGAKPRIKLVAKPENIEFKFGIGGDKTKDLLNVDLASFFESTIDHRVFQRADGMWQLIATSKSGKAKVIATFSLVTLELQHLIVRSPDTDQDVLLEIRDIAINHDDIAFTPFPNVDSFPKSVELVRTSDIESRRLLEAFGEVQHFLRVAMCQLAITDKKMRHVVKLPLNINWDRTQKIYFGAGCELRDLVRARANGGTNQTQSVARTDRDRIESSKASE